MHSSPRSFRADTTTAWRDDTPCHVRRVRWRPAAALELSPHAYLQTVERHRVEDVEQHFDLSMMRRASENREGLEVISGDCRLRKEEAGGQHVVLVGHTVPLVEDVHVGLVSALQSPVFPTQFASLSEGLGGTPHRPR